MNRVWVLVCDAARGRLFEVHEGERSWKTIATFEHEESRSKSSELSTDQTGRSSPRGGSVHHNALSPASSPKEVTEGHFVQSLTAMLDQAIRANRFKRWVLVAPPHFLGMVKKALTPELAGCLMASVDKDLSRVDADGLAEHLRAAVRIPPDQRDVVRETSRHAH